MPSQIALPSTGQVKDGGGGDGDGGLLDIGEEGGSDTISIGDGGPEIAKLAGLLAEQQVLALKGMLHESKARLKGANKEIAELMALLQEVRVFQQEAQEAIAEFM